MFVFLFLLIPQGCARLSAGPLPPARPTNIILLRGYLDWYSTGIDQLATELRTEARNAQAYREEQWGELADQLLKQPRRPLVLIGFSYGADDVILISRKLAEQQLPVDLLITIDPVTPASIPDNVRRCVNFYEPNGFWDLFPWLRGVPVDRGENINIRARADLNEPGTSHATIAGNPKVHAAIREMILSITAGRR